MGKDFVPTLCLDFDGVIHSYKSGWKGPRVIPDPPVQGAIKWLRNLLTDADCVAAMAPRYKDFNVQIYSSRSKFWGGRRAMRKWLAREFEKAGYYRQLVELIAFPSKKPAAFLTIDDRAFCFRGEFPAAKDLLMFKTWQQVPPVAICTICGHTFYESTRGPCPGCGINPGKYDRKED